MQKERERIDYEDMVGRIKELDLMLKNQETTDKRQKFRRFESMLAKSCV